ncbi:MAG: diaminopimelate decarboxylase [Opitutales bacterium]
METLRFIDAEKAQAIRASHGSPVFVYDEATLEQRAKEALAFPNAFGLTVRYAMKASPNRNILKLFSEMGLHFDCSSGHEVKRAMAAGIPAEKLSLSSQELPEDIGELLDLGISVNACSLSQIEGIGQARPGIEIGLRFNPGKGSGGNNQTNVGGPASSFGIWHELLEDARALTDKYNLTVFRIHTHIGSGSDPEVWKEVAHASMALAKAFPKVHTLNLGGGYKVGRMSTEKSTDLQDIGAPVKAIFEQVAEETGRKMHMEIEPGTFLVGNAACLLTTVRDIVETGENGYSFIKTDSGMTELLRPSLYGSQHPLIVIPQTPTDTTKDYVVVGHCCESGDLISCAPDEPGTLGPREMSQATIGDILIIEGVGAYCSGMPAKNYNSFPESAEVMLETGGTFRLIRKRQDLETIWANEI